MQIDNPLRCIIGTVGLPGERAFYWQIKTKSNSLSVRLEKQQAAVIAQQIENLLDDNFDKAIDYGRKSSPTVDKDPLDLPITEEFLLLGIGIFLNGANIEISLNLDGAGLPSTDEQKLQIVLSRNQAREFCARTRVVVAAGRSICPFCSLSIESSGHLCVRANGYRR